MMGCMTGFLIVEVSAQELEVLRAVRDGDVLVADFDQQVVTQVVDRGLLDRISGTYGGVALATRGRHPLWRYDRPEGLQNEPWERCEACGSTNMRAQSAWRSGGTPLRADCADCPYTWTATSRGEG
jgi:hypothetical protein